MGANRRITRRIDRELQIRARAICEHPEMFIVTAPGRVYILVSKQV